ncbi:MAG: alpha/beta hydrolase [Pseudonocardiaceae bacterium]
MSSRRHSAALATVAVLVTGAVLSTTLATTAFAQPEAGGSGIGGEVPGRYADQTIAWQPCFPDGPPPGLPPGSDRLECGSFTAPLDWADPDAGGSVTIAVSRLLATDDAEPAALFTNPGGPGAAGRFVPLLFLLTDRKRVLESQDIYGIDVRGTGASVNASCDGGSTTGILLDPRDRRPEQTDLILDSAELAARFCQHGTDGLGPFVRTDQTVADLDLLRHLIRQEKINWLGYSGGTWLGAYYATYFPQRVGRFVLDANTAFTDPWQVVGDLQPLGFQRRYEQDFLPWAATYDAIFGLGSTAAEVNQTYEDVRAALAAEPLDFGLGLAIYPVDLDGLIIGSMYSKLAFQSLAELIGFIRDEAVNRPAPEERSPLAAQQAEQVRAKVQQMRNIRAHSGGLQPLAPDSFNATFLHILCNDTSWRGNRESLLAGSQQQGEAYPLVGWGTLSNPCITWHRPDVSLRTPNGQGVPPVLMVQNERDPATPIEGALRARDGFAGARLLTVTDEGDHTTYASSSPNTCVNDAVEDYLLDGVVPEGDTSCPGNPIPPPIPVQTPDELPIVPLPLAPGDIIGTAQELIAALTELAGQP